MGPWNTTNAFFVIWALLFPSQLSKVTKPTSRLDVNSSILKMSLYCLLVYTVSGENSAAIFIFFSVHSALSLYLLLTFFFAAAFHQFLISYLLL